MREHQELHGWRKCPCCGFCKKEEKSYMKVSNYITMEEFLMDRAKKYPLTDELTGNANDVVCKVNELLQEFYQDCPDASRRQVTSGYRPAEINKNVLGAAKKSKHMTCQACDLGDNDKLLGEWCMKNLEKLEKIGLWMESLTTTHKNEHARWVHIQIISPHSGHRVFIP